MEYVWTKIQKKYEEGDQIGAEALINEAIENFQSRVDKEKEGKVRDRRITENIIAIKQTRGILCSDEVVELIAINTQEEAEKYLEVYREQKPNDPDYDKPDIRDYLISELLGEWVLLVYKLDI